MTPAELNLYARAYEKRRSAEQKAAQINLYSMAALIRPMIWSKHPPSYEQAFPENKPPKQNTEPMSDDQMYAMVKGLNALFGGEEVE